MIESREEFNRTDDSTKAVNWFALEREMLAGMLRPYVMGHKVPVSHETHQVFSYPDGVWQLLKHTYFPRWLERRFPTRYKRSSFVVTHNFYFACPHVHPRVAEQLRELADALERKGGE